MPTYRYRCPGCGDFERWRPIREPSETCECGCGQTAAKVMVPPLISTNALPNKGAAAKRMLARDAREDKDMWAYKRLRDDGLQPPRIDGCSLIEKNADDPLEVEMGRKIPRDTLNQSKEVLAELRENQRTGTGLDIMRDAQKVSGKPNEPKKVPV
jgi:putative FmdB family regulatory protein